jgi:hypothetical protein
MFFVMVAVTSRIASLDLKGILTAILWGAWHSLQASLACRDLEWVSEDSDMEWQLPQKPLLSVAVMANDDPMTIAAPNIIAIMTLNLIPPPCFFKLTIDSPVLFLAVALTIKSFAFGEQIKMK